MNNTVKVLLVSGLVGFLSACPNVPIKDGDGDLPSDTNGNTDNISSNQNGGATTGLENEQGISGTVIDNPNCSPDCTYKKDAIYQTSNMLATKIIYFDYDKSKVKDEFAEILNQHAIYLTEYPETRVRLEGHSDEQGSREYNVALGEKRAKAVKRHLQLQGVTNEQLSLVSFGEELPARLGHNNDAWSLNRRVEIVYE